MSILVAGGGGFIGSHLVKKLVETGEKGVVFDSQPISHSLQNLGGQVVGVKGDATQLADIRTIEVKMTVQAPAGRDKKVERTYTTRFRCRNLGL